MPPHIQANEPVHEDDNDDIRLGDHFWSCDLKGMNQLIGYITRTHDELDQLHDIYVERAELEHAFGQQLETLAGTSTKDDKDGVLGSIHVVRQELAKAAQSHLDFSKRLQENVAKDMKQWIQTHQTGLQKIKSSLDNLYEERQDTIGQLYQVREAYQALDKHSPKRQTLQNDYRLLLNKTDSILKHWNVEWKEACDQMEQMEQDRVDFFTANVWDYANLASARLMVQDEWCEAIRTQLETCSFEYERDQCIQQVGVGKLVPTTSDYVTHYFSQQKGDDHQQQPRSKSTSTEHINKSLPSKPPQQENTGSPQPKPSRQETPISPPSKPPRQENNMAPQQENTIVPSSIRRKPVDQASFKDKKVSAPMALEELLKKFENKSDGGRRLQRSRDPLFDTLSRPSPSSPPSTRPVTESHRSKAVDQQDKDRYMDKRVKQQDQQEKDSYMGRRTTQQIQQDKDHHTDKRATQQDQQDKDRKVVQQDKAEDNNTTTRPSKPNAHDHPMESNQNGTTSHEDLMSPVHPSPSTDRRPSSLGQPTSTIPPKSPRPQSQQITTSNPASGHMMNVPPPINTSPNYNYTQPPRSPLQSYAPPLSSNIAQQYQPATSPMLYPSNHPPVNNFQQSPMIPFQQPPSPMMQSYSPHPQHQQPLRSPGMIHAAPPLSPNLAPTWTAPGLSRPTSPYMGSRPSSPCMQRPTMLPDGTEILFWSQALYDYTAQDPVELSFTAHSVFAVIYVAMDGWWDAFAFDGHHFMGTSGSIPSNYMRRL